MFTGLIKYIDQTIKYCYYLIFFLVPLVIYPHTFELFEFNKMWITFGLTLIIAFLWITRIIVSGVFNFRRTPLDIPILLFLVSQILSTIFSLDRHVSIWGYYSRFNGGLLSTITYIFLYYAFASNLLQDKQTVLHKLASYKMLLVSLITGTVVALWGFPSHFGYDPTCLFFRGTLDVGCWTDAFQPMARIFSTLGQPNWLAAYLGVVLPIALAFFIKHVLNSDLNLHNRKKISILNSQFSISKKSAFLAACFLLLTILFYTDLIYSGSQSGFLAVWIGLVIMGIFYLISTVLAARKLSLPALWQNHVVKSLVVLILILFLTTFIIGAPIGRFTQFALPGIQEKLQKQSTQQTKNETPSEKNDAVSEQKQTVGDPGGTESSQIRLIVWGGALEIFKQNPIFGTGVETFAYAYYKVKLQEHNLTSEWDFLYNKAHNEYLNYLATTGILGIGSYLLLIGWFFYLAVRFIYFSSSQGEKTERMAFIQSPTFLLSLSLLGAYTSILVSNFFGFSVVIVNLYFFLIPLFFLELSGQIHNTHSVFLRLPFLYVAPPKATFPNQKVKTQVSLPAGHVMLILFLALILIYLEFLLIRFWVADQKYAQGYNLDKFAGFQGYIDGQPLLSEAVALRPGEDLYKDELSVNLSTLALIANQQNQTAQTAEFMKKAEELSNLVVANHPQNVIYYKTRTRVFYNLSQIDPKYFDEALSAIETAEKLAPTDAKIVYNKALLYGQAGKLDEAYVLLDKSIMMKPNYVDALYAKGLFLAQQADALKQSDPTKSAQAREKARETYQYILDNVDPNHKATKDALETL